MIRRLAAALVAGSMFATAAAAANTSDAATQGNSTDSQANPVEYPSQQSAPAPAAQPATQQPATSDKRFVNDGKWHFATLGYVWFAGGFGEVGVIKAIQPVKVDLPFKDVFNHLEFPWAIMGAAEARKDRLVILGDLMWAKLGATKDVKAHEIDLLSGSIEAKTLMVTALGGWRAVDEDKVKIDLLAGLRLNGTNNTVRVSGPNRSFSGNINKKWVDPVIATRAIIPLGGRFSTSLYGDIAGVLWGSKFSWQGIGTVNYQISRKMTLGAGYRYYKVDYESGGFTYDMSYRGPIIAFRTDF